MLYNPSGEVISLTLVEEVIKSSNDKGFNMKRLIFILGILYFVTSCSNQRAKRFLANSRDSKIKMSNLYSIISGDYQLENNCYVFNHIDATAGTTFRTRFSEYKEDKLSSRTRGHNSRFVLSSGDESLITITSSIQEMESLRAENKYDNYFIRIDKQGSKDFSIRISYDLNETTSIERNIIFAKDYLIWMEKDHFFSKPQTCIFRKVL